MMFEILFCIFTALLLWEFVGYPVFMGIYQKLRKSNRKFEPYSPFVSIVISVFNEEKMIESRLENLLSLNYPRDKYEIIIIDDKSQDSTVELIKNFLANNKLKEPEIKFIEKNHRLGKSNSLNMAREYINGDLVLSSDVNSLFDYNILVELTREFQNEKVGAVCGSYNILNIHDSSPVSENFYWNLEDMMLRGESNMDSIGTIIGSSSMWRKELFYFDEEIISEDLDLMVRITEKGYKVKYAPDAKVYERAATNISDLIIQRCRTALGTIQCVFKHPKEFLLFDKCHSFILYSHKALRMFSPFNLILAMVSLLLLPLNSMIYYLFASAFIFIALLMIILKLLPNSNTSQRRLNVYLVVRYVLINEFLILLAWKKFTFRDTSTKWEKAESTRIAEIQETKGK